MDLELIRLENEPKVGVQVRLYASTLAKIEALAKRENVKISWVIRHILNSAFENDRNLDITQTTKETTND